jgi:hypothetical protein
VCNFSHAQQEKKNNFDRPQGKPKSVVKASKPGAPQPAQPRKQCENCGVQNHERKDCQWRGTCNHCGRENHKEAMCRDKKAGKPKALLAREYDGEPVRANLAVVKSKRKISQVNLTVYSETDDDGDYSCGSNPMPPASKSKVRTVLRPIEDDFDMYGSFGDLSTGVCEASDNLFEDSSWDIPTPKYN